MSEPLRNLRRKGRVSYNVESYFKEVHGFEERLPKQSVSEEKAASPVIELPHSSYQEDSLFVSPDDEEDPIRTPKQPRLSRTRDSEEIFEEQAIEFQGHIHPSRFGENAQETMAVKMPVNPFTSIVKVRVGKRPEEFIIHSQFLIDVSEWFEARLASSNTIELPDIKPGTFWIFSTWLYSESLPAGQNETEVKTLVDLYLLAESLEVTALAEDIVFRLSKNMQTNQAISMEMVDRVYAATSPGSKLRQVVAVMCARNERSLDGASKEVLCDIIAALKGMMSSASTPDRVIMSTPAVQRKRKFDKFLPPRENEENGPVATQQAPKPTPVQSKTTSPARARKTGSELLKAFNPR